MPASKYANGDTALLPPNLMDLRDEAFYGLVHQVAGKRVAELLAFQECNGVDSFLACTDVTAVLRLDSADLHEIRKTTCIMLSDGTISLLPGIEASINNLAKLLRKKREEIGKQFERLQSITPSSFPIPIVATSVLSTTPLIANSSLHASSSVDASTPATTANSYSTAHTSLNPEITNKISTTVVDWLKKKQNELRLTDMNFQSGKDFDLELNSRYDGIVFRCKCGTKCGIAQKRGNLVFSNVFRHLKGGKCSAVIERQLAAVDDMDGESETEEDADVAMAKTQSSSASVRRSSRKPATLPLNAGKKRTRSVSNVSRRTRKRMS